MAGLARRFEHEGVEGLRVGRFNLGVNTTCVVYRLGSALIDTGPPNQWRAVGRFAKEREIRRALVTHHHEDHSGNAAPLVRELGVEVSVPQSSVRLVREGFPLRGYQKLIWGTPERCELPAVPDQLELSGGWRLHTIAAPGHSSDMTCFLEPERGWLFAGDLFITRRPRFMREDEEVSLQIESLDRVGRLDFSTLFCAHRGVVVDGAAAIRAKHDYLVSLREEVRRLHDEGRSIDEITRALSGPETWLSRITLYHFSKRNLVRGCLAPERATN